MFEQMVSDLKKGTWPDIKLLRKRFDAALVKKMGVIRTPYTFWTSDTKINPPAKQLLWAAILLQDRENCTMIEAVISTELEEQQQAKGEQNNMQELAAKVQLTMHEYVSEFIGFAPDETFRENLRHKAEELFPDLQDP